MVRQAEVNYLQSLVQQSKNSSQKASYMWSCVNNIIGRIKTKKVVLRDSLTLDSLNNHFQTVTVTSMHQSANTFAVPDDSCDTDRFTFAEISESLVLLHLNSLDVKKSTGPDGLSAKFLKEIANEIAAPLAMLFNCSLQSGVVPAICKNSNITAVHKGGALDDPGNYRPISVVSVLAKVLEKIVSVQLGTFLEQTNALNPHQGLIAWVNQLRIFCCLLLTTLSILWIVEVLSVLPFWISGRHLTLWITVYCCNSFMI